MGAAKRRGTREQRIEQAIARRKIEDAARSAAYKAQRQAEAERVRNLPPQERKEVLLAGGGVNNAMLLAALSGALAASGTVIAYDKGNDDISHREP